jgi:hypothetical protein
LYQVLLLIRLKSVIAGEIQQVAVHTLEIPGVIEVDPVMNHVGFRGNTCNVLSDLVCQVFRVVVEKELQPIDQQVIVLAHRDIGAPLVPTLVTCTAPVFSRAENTDSYCFHTI